MDLSNIAYLHYLNICGAVEVSGELNDTTRKKKGFTLPQRKGTVRVQPTITIQK